MHPRHSGLISHTRPASRVVAVAALVVAATTLLAGAPSAIAATDTSVSTDPAGAHVP